uniref:Uncharacterized protein n=1 Tax=Anguilla anguilla TaxID=7936 RepID=A0A0E9TWY8_ANGAN
MLLAKRDAQSQGANLVKYKSNYLWTGITGSTFFTFLPTIMDFCKNPVLWLEQGSPTLALESCWISLLLYG